MTRKTSAQAAMLCLCCLVFQGCSAGNIRLYPFNLKAEGRHVARDLVIDPVEFDYDNRNLQDSSHVCLWTLIPFCLYRQLGRGCNGNAFLLRPSKFDSPELIPERISNCVRDSLKAATVFHSVVPAEEYWRVDAKTQPLVLRGKITECREVGYGTTYGLSVVGMTLCMVVPIIPTNYGNHIRFSMELELFDPTSDRVVWRGFLRGHTQKRVRFFWQVRDFSHGTNDFDEELSKFLQSRLGDVVQEMLEQAFTLETETGD